MIKDFKTKKKYHFLSNFYPCEIQWGDEGFVYPSSEHLYVAFKCGYFEPNYAAEIYITELIKLSAGGAKKLGSRKTINKEEWDNIKVDVMYKILKTKFTQNPKLKKKLLKTGDKHIQEGNWWGDTFWGVDLKTGKGENVLGKLLMIVRSELKYKYDI